LGCPNNRDTDKRGFTVNTNSKAHWRKGHGIYFTSEYFEEVKGRQKA